MCVLPVPTNLITHVSHLYPITSPPRPLKAAAPLPPFNIAALPLMELLKVLKVTVGIGSFLSFCTQVIAPFSCPGHMTTNQGVWSGVDVILVGSCEKYNREKK